MKINSRKPVYFEAYNNSVISDVVVNIVSNVTTDSWDIELKTYFINSSGQSEIKGKLTVLLITDITVIYSIFELNLVQTVNQEYISINNVSVPKVRILELHHVYKCFIVDCSPLLVFGGQTDTDVKSCTG